MASKELGELKSKVTADVSGFKTGMDEVKRSLNTNQNTYKVAASAARAFGTAQDALRAKQQMLIGQFDAQKKKVQLLQVEYKKSASAKGTDAAATQKLADELARAQAALNNTQADLKGVNAQLKQQERNASTLSKAWGGLKNAAAGAGAALKTIGKAALVGIGGAGAALTAAGLGIGKLAMDAGAAGEELVEMSAKTGISVTRLQELKYAGELVGTDIDTLAGGLSKLKRAMGNAEEGTGGAADAFALLGVPVTDANGALRDSELVMEDTLKALGKMTNETERDVVAMEIFGKSAAELNPLIEAGWQEIERLGEEAHKMGAVMAEEDVQAAADFKDQIDSLKMGMEGTVATVGTAFMPALGAIATKGGGYLKQFAKVVQESDGDLGKMGSGISDLAGSIVQEIAAELPRMMEAGMTILQGILNGILENLPMLISTAVEIILSLTNFLIANLPMILGAALQIIIALAQGLSTALPTLIPAITSMITTIVQVLAENLPMLIMAGLQLLGALAQGLIAAIPVLVNAIPEIAQSLATAFSDAWPQMQEIGSNIVSGIWEGILGMKDQFSEDVKAFFKGIVDAVKSVLGIQSPSKLMMPLGKFTVAGYVEGLKNASRKMQAEVNASMRGLALGGAAAGASVVQESYTFYGSVAIGGGIGQRMSTAVKAKRF